MEPVEHVKHLLQQGALEASELTARRLGEVLGKTTSVLYHHWGSLDGFLHAVAASAMVELQGRLVAAAASPGGLEAVAVAYVEFGLESPALYALMFERRYDWAALRASGGCGPGATGLDVWRGVVQQLRAAGSTEPERDARVLHAGLHGLVSLAASGRANVDALQHTDADVARDSARHLARLVAAGFAPRKGM